MNPRIRAVFRKELRDLRRNKFVVGSMVALPLILGTLWFAMGNQFQFHRRIARWTFPIWLYVSVTGVIVYVLLKFFVT